MWIPTSEQEILLAIDTGDLIETATFDAKASLPAKGKDLAIDVAAMATDGGSLLYGLGEDENDRPTVPQPFKLAGARERVDQIVRTSISDPLPSKYIRSQQRMIRVWVTSWSTSPPRPVRHIWSPWARTIDITVEALLAMPH